MFQRIVLVLAALAASAQAKDFEIEEFSKINGGWRGDTHVRRVGDVNGDGKADLIGFGHYGVGVALSTGTDFVHDGLWYAPGYTGQTGWSKPIHERHIADVNGDGKDDIVGFGGCVHVALSDGERFNYNGCWTHSFSNPTWSKAAHHVRRLGDVNGDGRADVVAFGHGGTWVAYSNGNGFDAPVFAINNFAADAGGWNNDAHPRRLADVNGDGRDDLVAFGHYSVFVAHATGNPNAPFGPAQAMIHSSFTVSGTWSGSAHVREVADVTGDGLADIVGFAHPLVVVFRSTGDGFAYAGHWLVNDMAYTKHEWRVEDTPRLLGDVNGDGRADAVGFHWARTYVRLSDGEKFVRPTTNYAPLGTTMITSMRPMHSNLCMYVHDTPGAPVVQGRCNPDAVSTVNWEIEALDDGTAFIRTPNGACLRTQNDAQGDQIQVVVGACDDVPTARWRIGREPDGQSLIQPAFSDRFCLGVPDASPHEGTILQVQYCDYYPNEMWRLETLHPKVVTGKLRTAAGQIFYGGGQSFPEQALDLVDSGKGWHSLIDPQTGLCGTSVFWTSPGWLGATHSHAQLAFNACTGAGDQRFVLEAVENQPSQFRMQVPQNPQWCFGGDGWADSSTACGLAPTALTLTEPEAFASATMRLHGVQTPSGPRVVLTIDSPLDRKIIANPEHIVLLLAREGIALSDADETLLFGAPQPAPPAPEDDPGLINSMFIQHADGQGEESLWHNQPEWRTGDEWGDASVEVTYNTTKYRVRNASNEASVDVGAELVGVSGGVGDEDGNYAGAGVALAIGLEAGGKWGANDQYGFTIGIKAVTIKLYVNGDDALHGMMVAANGIHDGFAATAQGIAAVGGTIVDTVHVVGTFFTDVGNGIADTASDLGNAIAEGFCGVFGC